MRMFIKYMWKTSKLPLHLGAARATSGVLLSTLWEPKNRPVHNESECKVWHRITYWCKNVGHTHTPIVPWTPELKLNLVMYFSVIMESRLRTPVETLAWQQKEENIRTLLCGKKMTKNKNKKLANKEEKLSSPHEKNTLTRTGNKTKSKNALTNTNTNPTQLTQPAPRRPREESE